MEIKTKYKNFLLSKDANFISHAISKIHSTHNKNNGNKNFYQILSLFRKFLYIFDESNKYPKNNEYIDVIIVSNLVSIKNINNDLYFGNLSTKLKKKKIKTISVYRNHTFLTS